MAEAVETNTSLQEMVSDPSMEDVEGEDPLVFDTGQFVRSLAFSCFFHSNLFQILTTPTANDPSLFGLKEISSLASWTVSTHKPHCGAAALLQPTPATFWQSDGPQPHLLTLHFPKTVTIRKLRVYLDFALDESYTPTRMEFYGGVHGADYGLVQFAEWKGEGPRGWQDISIEGCGPGASDGVRARVIQVRVMENHQNGKDTHIRGVQVFARDERMKRMNPLDDSGDVNGMGGIEGLGELDPRHQRRSTEREFIGEEPDWMAEPELR